VEILAQSSTAFVLTYNFQGTHILGASRGVLAIAWHLVIIRALIHSRALLTNDAVISVANSIVSSRLDYCNILLCNAAERNLNKLQRMQNTLARVCCQSPRSPTASNLQKSLAYTVHWLPVRQRLPTKPL